MDHHLIVSWRPWEVIAGPPKEAQHIAFQAHELDETWLPRRQWKPHYLAETDLALQSGCSYSLGHEEAGHLGMYPCIWKHNQKVLLLELAYGDEAQAGVADTT